LGLAALVGFYGAFIQLRYIAEGGVQLLVFGFLLAYGSFCVSALVWVTIQRLRRWGSRERLDTTKLS